MPHQIHVNGLNPKSHFRRARIWESGYAAQAQHVDMDTEHQHMANVRNDT